jgi:hypothetical protein
LLCLFVDVTVLEHIQQLLFLFVVKPARRIPFPRVLIGSEQHIPPDYVTVVVSMAVVLVVYAVHLRTLKEVANPPRGFDIRMVEELADGSASSIESARFDGEPQERVYQKTSNERIDDHFARVFIE